MTRDEFDSIFINAITIPVEYYADGTVYYQLVGNDTDVDKVIEYITSLEQQIENLNSNIEAQDIMIADYKKHIEELEAPKSCGTCMWYGEKHCKNENSIAYNADNAVYEDDCCKDHEPKDK